MHTAEGLAAYGLRADFRCAQSGRTDGPAREPPIFPCVSGRCLLLSGRGHGRLRPLPNLRALLWVTTEGQSESPSGGAGPWTRLGEAGLVELEGRGDTVTRDGGSPAVRTTGLAAWPKYVSSGSVTAVIANCQQEQASCPGSCSPWGVSYTTREPPLVGLRP